MQNIIFNTDKLAVGYNKKILIDNIDISVNKGEIVTLIGPNGAGKSTVLKTIAAQLPMLAGSVFISGKNLKDISNNELAKTMSIMTTASIRPELMTCYDVIKSGRYPYTGQLGILSENDKKQIAEAMKLMSVESIADRDFNCISDGQRQRVMLARAVCQEPDVLILDEPTSFLDIHHKLELLSMLKRLVTIKKISVIMSMHELDLAQRISDFVICISNGGIDKCGAPEEIFTDEYISRLYDISAASYYSGYGSAELERVSGQPQVFVIAGGGTGINTFRRLQRMQIPFAAGIIYENDIDFPAASALAAEVVSEKAFEPISAYNFDKAVKLMENCRKVICCTEHFGTLNSENKKLYEYAKENNRLWSKNRINVNKVVKNTE
ncbi:MAG: ABC transporter ATP-binding protein [Clostridium sp.]|nr:ABC transporter ATP-binding protein [Clostridium sp.]MCM1547008.1 ABC transporter ATP-binding protein [Ruminococcus sp.]